MIVDCHTHLMWYPEHVSEQYAQEALASKLIKLKYSGGQAYAGRLDLHSYDSTPETHWQASQAADKVVVFGLQAKATGIWVPNELVAHYVRQHPEKLVGWASVDPNEPDCVEQLEYCVTHLGLRGLKLGPTYQHFNPQDRKHWPLFEKCVEHNLPIMWHQGTTFPSRARLSWALPLQLEDVAMAFPDLRMIIAHLGHPWETDVVVLIRKCPNLYTDISAVHYRPWRYWQAMVTAMEYGVDHKILLASDFPSGTITNVINGLRTVNAPVEGTNLPKVPKEVQDRIIEENWKAVFPEWA
ncbi:MAG: amidohydrolase family protein [Armatimonadota bacterium]|nr:amidohydrolase family protein [Armatimonadota bacterium]